MNRFAAREMATFSPDLSNGAVRLYLALDEYARDSGICWPRQKTLTGRLGCSVRQLQRYLLELTKAGLCIPERSTPGGANRYRLVYVRNHTTPVSLPGDMDVATLATPVSPHIRNKQDIETELPPPATEMQIQPQPRCVFCSGSGFAGTGANKSACGICRGTGKALRRA